MTAHDTALRVALLKVLTEQLAAAKRTVGEEVAGSWRVKDRSTAVLPDGTEIGTVTLAEGRTAAKVSDDDAYLAWVLENHPEEIEQIAITRVNPDFTARTLSFARQHGEPVDPATGETVAGVVVQQGDPYPMAKLSPEAADLVAKAWQDGSLSELVASLVQPAIEAGES